MKKVILTGLVSAALLLSLTSCSPTVSKEEYDALQKSLESAQQDSSRLQENLAQLQSKYDAWEAQYKSLLQRLKESTLMNPTWAELKAFVETDGTDRLSYIEGQFDCEGFAITLRDNAGTHRFRCAYVALSFDEGVGHALNAFQTGDKGLIYIDNTQSDTVGYVKIGQPYGTICLDGVKDRFIDCGGDPAKFWSELTYSTHPNPFGYDYYTNYRSRVRFCEESVEAYNKAVAEYNRGSREWTYSQLNKWLENLQALKKDLGPRFSEEGRIVKNAEVYWN